MGKSKSTFFSFFYRGIFYFFSMSRPRHSDTNFRLSVVSSALAFELNKLKYKIRTSQSEELRQTLKSVCDILSQIKHEVDVVRSR